MLPAFRIGIDIRPLWQRAGAPFYHTYSASTLGCPHTKLEGSTAATMFLDVGVREEPLKISVVLSSTKP